MMSDEEKLSLLVRVGEAFNALGFDGIFPFVDPDFEFHEPPEQIGSSVFRGEVAAREGFAGWAETWAEQKSEAQSFEILPDGRALVFTRERLLGRDGLRLENDCGSLFTFRGDRLLRWQVFWDPENARRAAAAPPL